MFSSRLNAALLTFALGTGAGAAHATTITFDEFPTSSTTFLGAGDSFATNGYNFNVGQASVFFLNSGNGTTSMDLGGIVTVTNAASKPFSLASIDLRTVWSPGTSTVKLTGIDVGGSQIIQSYTISGANSPNPAAMITYSPTGFNNLTSLVMELVYNQTEATYFSLVDNLVFNEQAVSAVPEPETWAMLGLGLAMVAGLSRRKRG